MEARGVEAAQALSNYFEYSGLSVSQETPTSLAKWSDLQGPDVTARFRKLSRWMSRGGGRVWWEVQGIFARYAKQVEKPCLVYQPNPGISLILGWRRVVSAASAVHPVRRPAESYPYKSGEEL